MKSKLYRYRISEITKYNTDSYYIIEFKEVGFFSLFFDIWREANPGERYNPIQEAEDQIIIYIYNDNKQSSNKIKSKKKIK